MTATLALAEHRADLERRLDIALFDQDPYEVYRLVSELAALSTPKEAA